MSVKPQNSINNTITQAAKLGVSAEITDPFLENVSFIEQTPNPYIFSNLFQQNVKLARKIIDFKTTNTTEDKKAYYQKEQNFNIEYILNFLYYLYYGCLVIFILVLYMKSVFKNVYYLLVVSIILALYPFLMINLERWALTLYRFIASLVFGIPFAFPKHMYLFQTPTGHNWIF